MSSSAAGIAQTKEATSILGNPNETNKIQDNNLVSDHAKSSIKTKDSNRNEMISQMSSLSLGGSNDCAHIASHTANSNNLDLFRQQNKVANTTANFGVPVPNRVFVGGIPVDATEHEVRQLFAHFGSIISVKIITDRTGLSRKPSYGFVTFENEIDAQKVIKDAENLFIRNRKLNVSTAVMRHQPNTYDSRMFNGALIYPHLAYNGLSGYAPFYADNFSGLCSSEGISLYQLAGMNSHYISNCPSLIAASPSGVEYLAHSAYASPYAPSNSNYLYGNAMPAGSGAIPSIISPNSLYPSPATASSVQAAQAAHLLSPEESLSYSYANGTPTGALANSAMRYPILPSSASHSAQAMSMNDGSSHHQYIQYSNNRSPLMSNTSLHLATALPMHHPHSIAHLNEHHLHNNSVTSQMANSVSTNVALLSQPNSLGQQSVTSCYPNYSLNMAATNSPQLACVPLKNETNGLVMDAAAMANGVISSNASVSNTGAGGHAIPMHTVGYLPQMMEVVWPNSSNYNMPTTSTVTLNQHSANSMANYSNSSSNYIKPSSRTLNLAPNLQSKPGSMANANKTTVHNLNASAMENGHMGGDAHNKSASSNGNDYGNSFPASKSGGNFLGSNSIAAPSIMNKDKILKNARCSSISSHPPPGQTNNNNNKNKMYNGLAGTANNAVGNNVESKPKPAANQVSSNGKYSSSNCCNDSFGAGGGSAGLKNANAIKPSLVASNNVPPPPTSSHGCNPSMVTASASAVAAANQTYVTKTVNGVQIYALAGNVDLSTSGDKAPSFPIASIGDL